MMTHPHQFRTALLCLLACILLAGSGCEEKIKNESANIQNNDLGRDPQPYRTAEEMYRCGDEAGYDLGAGELVRRMSTILNLPLVAQPEELRASLRELSPWIRSVAVAGGQRPDACTIEVRELLIQLNPYRKAGAVQEALRQWVGQVIDNIRASPCAEQASLDAANAAYEAGKYEEAAAAYAKALEECPRSLDGRNNLALAEMHANHDLSAQLHLEVLRKMEPKYVPAVINLTVLCERLGDSPRSRALAEEAYNLQRDYPACRYNLAWHEESNEQITIAAALIKPVAELSLDPRHAELNRLIRQHLPEVAKPQPAPDPAAAQPSVWKQGLAGLCHGRSGLLAHTAATTIFGLSFFFVIVIAAAIGSAGRLKKPGVAAFWCIVLGTFWYIVYWGVPTGGGWVLLIGYTLVGTMIAAGAANS